MLGKLLQGRYQVVQVLSTGGFCQTYLAQDTNQPGNPTYVVKHLKLVSNHHESLPTLSQLFTREIQALKKLGKYDQVPQLVDHFEENNEFYLVQEFIEGHPLSAELQPGQRWSESFVVQLLQEVLCILEFVHCHGLIHRDIKPSNLIRRQQDNRLVLIDFGAVKQIWKQVVTVQGHTSARLTQGIPATIAIGTPGYMSTEQGRGRPRRNSDIYALGMIGIQALTGRAPTQLLEDSDTGEIIWQHQAQVSAELASILNKMVRYHFKDRYQSAIEALQALQPLVKKAEGQGSRGAEGQRGRGAEGQRGRGAEENIDTNSPLLPCSPAPLLPSEAGSPTSHNKSALLIAMGIGFASALALIVGSYYSLRPPAPTSKVQKYSVSIPSKNTALGNITLANTLTGHSDVVWCVSIRSNNHTLVSSSGDSTIKLWNLRTGELLRTLSGHSGTVWSIALSPDGQILASGSSDNTINIWKLGSGELLRTLVGHTAAVWSIALSPDGQILASGSSDNTIKVWKLGSGELLRTLSGHTDAVRSIALSSDGQILASGSSDNTIKVWKLSSRELLQTMFGHKDRVISVAISPDGQLLASGSVDKTIKIWNLSNGKLLRTLSGNSDWVNSVAISPDGQILASGIGDIINIWNLNTGELLYKLSSNSSDITSVSFSANGETLVSSSRDKTINIWRLRSSISPSINS